MVEAVNDDDKPSSGNYADYYATRIELPRGLPRLDWINIETFELEVLNANIDSAGDYILTCDWIYENHEIPATWFKLDRDKIHEAAKELLRRRPHADPSAP